MKRTLRRVSLVVAGAVCWGAVAHATSPDRSVEMALAALATVVTAWTERGFQDEETFFRALTEITPSSRPEKQRSALNRMTGISGFEQRFYFGPAAAQGAGAKARAFAATATSPMLSGRELAFCADTTPLVCVRRDGVEPRVKAGRCEDPRCEVFARDGQVRDAPNLFSAR